MTGTTIEVNNTDAEGRLVLCDCLAYAVAQGAERIVDIATLTGGDRHGAGLDLRRPVRHRRGPRRAVTAAGAAAGELLWRMPLHPDYDEQIKGRYADIVNSAGPQGPPDPGRPFLKRFVGDVPWAHLDIAGTGHGHGPPVPGQGRRGLGRAPAARTGARALVSAAVPAPLLGLCRTSPEPEGRHDPC